MNIIHRDVKFHNILVSDGGNNFHLTDFGTAHQLLSATSKTVERVGTLGFYAPEIIEGKPYGIAVDIFSLGCILFTLLTEQLLFTEPGLPLEREQYKERLVNDSIDSYLDLYGRHLCEPSKDLLRGMLNKEPEKRFTPK